MVLTLRLIVLYGLLRCTTLTDRFCITEVESVYCVLRTGPLIKQTHFVFKGLIINSVFSLELNTFLSN